MEQGWKGGTITLTYWRGRRGVLVGRRRSLSAAPGVHTLQRPPPNRNVRPRGRGYVKFPGCKVISWECKGATSTPVPPPWALGPTKRTMFFKVGWLALGGGVCTRKNSHRPSYFKKNRSITQQSHQSDLSFCPGPLGLPALPSKKPEPKAKYSGQN